jgi:outer membrane biosynthesis protein TonB
MILIVPVLFRAWAADAAEPAAAAKAPETAAPAPEKPADAAPAAPAEPKAPAPEEAAPPPPPPEGAPPPDAKPPETPPAPQEAPAKDATKPDSPAAKDQAAKDPPKPAAPTPAPAAETSKAAPAPAATAAAPAEAPATPPALTPAVDGKGAAEHKGPGFDTFRILIDRNIFSAKRTPKSAAGAAAKDGAPKPKTQVLRLMGTYLTPERTLALFEGTDSVPGGGIKQGESIAGYRLEEIRVDAAVLSNDKGKIEVPVGSGLSQAEDKSWALVDKPVVEHPAAASSAAAPGSSPEAAASDPVEKLRARRRKELGQ